MICPYVLDNYVTTPGYLLLLQSFIVLFATNDMPATPILLKYFPVLKRFTCAGFAYALSRSLMYVITSFGFIYLIEFFGYYGLLIIMIPISIGFMFGVSHFEKLEKYDRIQVN